MKSGFPQHRLTEAAMELVRDLKAFHKDLFSFFTRTCFLSSAGFPVETNASHMAEEDLPTVL